MVDHTKIHVGPGGTFEPKGDFHSSPGDIDDLVNQLISNNQSSLTIHFHGGLVSESNGVKVANMMAPVYSAANNYPVAFIWETGLIETFRDNLSKLNETKLYRKLIKWVAKRTAQRFGGLNAKGAGEPISDSEIEEELNKVRPFIGYDSKETGKGAARGGDIAVNEDDLGIIKEELEAEFEEEIEADEEIEILIAERQNQDVVDASEKGLFSSIKLARKLAKIAYRVIKRHVRDRDHGFHCTIVEEVLREYYLADLGAWVWGNMKDKAEAMWLPNDGLSDEEQHVGFYFLDALQKLQSMRPEFTINLVGHSAGSIVICYMLNSISRHFPSIKINNVVFMAAAVRSDLAVKEIANHPERFIRFYYYTMDDSYEREDILVPYAYSRSLLYLISGVLEPDEVDLPLAGMMRYATLKEPFTGGVARAWTEFINAEQRSVLSDTNKLNPGAGDGQRCTALKHGDFDNDPEMQHSLSHILMS